MREMPARLNVCLTCQSPGLSFVFSLASTSS